MIWLTWRQLRTQAATAYTAAIVLAAVLAATGPHLASQYHADGTSLLDNVSALDTLLYWLGTLAVLALPVLIGMFWGAPLVTRELDAGTHRLAWTQTVTRTRWVAAKLGLTAAAAMAAAGLLGLVLTWWSSPVDQAIAALNGKLGPGLFLFPRLSPEMFDARGIAPVGYAALAFTLGVTVGVIVRSTLPAMLVSLGAYAVTAIGMSVLVRPHLFAPDRTTVTITGANLLRISRSGALSVSVTEPGAWVTSQHTVNASGRAVTAPRSLVSNCLLGPGKTDPSCFARLAREGYRQLVSYQPASRFWALQSTETVICLVLALLLAAFCAWWIRSRLS